MVRDIKTATLGRCKSGFRRNAPRSDESGGRNLDGITAPPGQGSREGRCRIRAAAHIPVTDKKNRRYVASPKERLCRSPAPAVKKPIRKVPEKVVCSRRHAPDGTTGIRLAVVASHLPVNPTADSSSQAMASLNFASL